jgi:hypothetical protein
MCLGVYGSLRVRLAQGAGTYRASCRHLQASALSWLLFYSWALPLIVQLSRAPEARDIFLVKRRLGGNVERVGCECRGMHGFMQLLYMYGIYSTLSPATYRQNYSRNRAFIL